MSASPQNSTFLKVGCWTQSGCVARISTRLAVSLSPLRRKMPEFKPVLKYRMTPRELIAFVGVSSSVRWNKEKSAGSAIGTREDIMLDKAPNGRVSDLLNTLDKALSTGEVERAVDLFQTAATGATS
jgi:hypothetical protein